MLLVFGLGLLHGSSSHRWAGRVLQRIGDWDILNDSSLGELPTYYDLRL